MVRVNEGSSPEMFGGLQVPHETKCSHDNSGFSSFASSLAYQLSGEHNICVTHYRAEKSRHWVAIFSSYHMSRVQSNFALRGM